MLDEAVADEASIHEDVDGVAVEFLDLRLGDEAMNTQFAAGGWVGYVLTFRIFAGEGARATLLVFIFILICVWAAPWRRLGKTDAFQGLQGSDRNQLIQNLLAEDLVYTFAISRDGRSYQHGVSG